MLIWIDRNRSIRPQHPGYVQRCSAAGVFSGHHRDDFGGNTYSDLRCHSSRPSTDKRTGALDRAFEALAHADPTTALAAIDSLDQMDLMARQIRVKALQLLGDSATLIELVRDPQSAEEVMILIELLIESGEYEEAQTILRDSERLVGPGVARDLLEKIEAHRLEGS